MYLIYLVVDHVLIITPRHAFTLIHRAPKIQTMAIIDEIEGRPRGIYSGCIGFIGEDGAADLNIVIRTAVVRKGTITVGAGGAITALSCPQTEVDEVELKANAVAKAIGYTARFK